MDTEKTDIKQLLDTFKNGIEEGMIKYGFLNHICSDIDEFKERIYWPIWTIEENWRYVYLCRKMGIVPPREVLNTLLFNLSKVSVIDLTRVNKKKALSVFWDEDKIGYIGEGDDIFNDRSYNEFVEANNENKETKQYFAEAVKTFLDERETLISILSGEDKRSLITYVEEIGKK